VITVVKAGLLASVQDLGRPGFRDSGMPVAGAMDRHALACANLLAGNEPGAAAVELTMIGGSWRFEADAFAAVAGADMGGSLDGVPIGPWSSFHARAGSLLAFRSAASGVRAYLAVRGGIDVPLVLGSRSTYTRAGVGGLGGRSLATGDRLPVGRARGRAPAPRALSDRAVPPAGGGATLRVLLGPQDDRFTARGIETFLSSGYRVTPQNDRMGYRLEGPPIAMRGEPDIITDPLVPGAVQVPGNGQPIVMAVDAQTTGGYVKIATVIGPDLRLLAQARAGDLLRFARTTQAAAVKAVRAERAGLAALARRIAGHGPQE
jgi:antagonist of KipI